MGAAASKFCSDECRKIRFKPEKPKFQSEFRLIPKEDLGEKKLTVPVAQQAAPQRITLSLPHDKRPVIYTKPNSEEMVLKVKTLLGSSATLEHVIANVLTKHKYKDPKHCASHIEDMLTFYDPEN